MNGYRQKYRRHSWVMTILVLLATWLSVGWECTGAMAAPVASVRAAQGDAQAASPARPAMPCHTDAATLANGAACDMPCCPHPSDASGQKSAAPQRHSSPTTCMTPKTGQAEIIATDVHQPVLSLVAITVPPLLMPAMDASIAAPSTPSTIPLPLREPLSRNVPSRAPPALA